MIMETNMLFTAAKLKPLNYKTDCAVVFCHAKSLLPSAAAVDSVLKGTILSLLKSEELGAKAGKSAWLNLPETEHAFKRVLCVSLGEDKESTAISLTDIRKALQGAASALVNSSAKHVAFYPDMNNYSPMVQEQFGQLLAQTLLTESYSYRTTKPSATKACALKKVAVDTSSPKLKQQLDYGAAIASGINEARELGNLPGNICTPSFLAQRAKELAASSAKLKVKILSEAQMEKLGMGSLLSVSRGSDEPAKLIVMEYQGTPAKKTQPHVLVGKGITFDTGGISLKPGAAMDEMKFDMCGAASVFGTMQSLIQLQAEVNVVGIVAAAENMPSGKATKPGDVVTSMSGQTIEILNTDAEGRLVLCDALSYAERYKPASVIDIATLTGACVVALGHHASGLFSNDQDLATALLSSGEQSHDRAWQMPLWEDYQQSLDSNFADMANIGGREAGAITAACFLSRFTKKYKWAHLDIAGAAWVAGKAKGATGRPVALLVHYLMNN